MKQLSLFMILLCLSTNLAFAQKKVAVVKLLRGEVDVLTMGKTSRLKVEDWVEDGSVVKTAEKSFVKLIFIDKSQMNIGPGSEMKIEKFSGKDSGVIDLVKGKIRSQVTKDYLQMDQNRSKLFIKTPNAVMGVRGTDFMISTNGKNTSTVLFEGAIVFNRLENRGEVNSANLEDIVNRGVYMYPGEFSVVDGRIAQPTIPSLLNIQQKEKLEKAENFEADRTPGNSEAIDPKKSVVPKGLNGQMVSNDSAVLKTEVGAAAPAQKVSDAGKAPASINPESFTTDGKFKPANGSYLHVESGTIVAPAPDSVYDPNSNTYLPVNSGSVSQAGDYIPPSSMEITSDGTVLVKTTDASGQTVVQTVDTTGSTSLNVTGVVSTADTTKMAGTTSGTTITTSDSSIKDQGGITTYYSNQINTNGGIAVPGTSGQIFDTPTTRTTITVGQ